MLAAGSVAVLALGCSLAVVAGRRALAEQAGGAAPGAYDGAQECKNCHTQQTTLEQGAALPFVMLDEYAIWKTLDKHAQAYAVLRTERSQKMAKLLKTDVLKPEGGCLNCHAMNALKTSPGETFNPEDGVSCGGCHGPSSGWLNDHSKPAWRKLPPEEKSRRRMKDLRDPVVRAELCMSCHVGNAAEGKVVTHAMFAAGHPPLPPFEVATFCQNEPQHWRDAKEVPFFSILKDVADLKTTDKSRRAAEVRKILTRYRQADIDKGELNRFLDLYPTREEAEKVLAQYPFAGRDTQQTRIALVGNVVALRALMKLAADRANPGIKADPKAVWPELLGPTEDSPAPPDDAELRKLSAARWGEVAMAHSDCYACHHDLQYPGYRQKRGYGYRLPGGGMIATTPGRVQVRAWPLAVLGPGVLFASKGEGSFKGNVDRLAQDLSAVAKACDDRPFGEPARVGAAAQQVITWCDALLKRLQDADLDRKTARGLLKDLCGMDALASADYEGARQIASVFAVAYQELYPRAARNGEVEAVLAGLTKDLNLKPYTQRARRQELIREVILGANKDVSDIKEFWKSVGDRGDMALLLKLRRNKFLDAIRNEITNDRMNELLQTGVVAKLEAISDKELDASLRNIAAYNPVTFRERMKELGGLLPEE
jgi:hypothetical protein